MTRIAFFMTNLATGIPKGMVRMTRMMNVGTSTLLKKQIEIQ
jgi:hypothetical protein